MEFDNVLVQGKKTSTEQTDLVHKEITSHKTNLERYAKENGCEQNVANAKLSHETATRLNSAYKDILNPECKIVGASMGSSKEHLFVKRRDDENVYVVNPSTGKVEGHYDKTWRNYKRITDGGEPPRPPANPFTGLDKTENLTNKQGANVVEGTAADPRKVIVAKEGVATDGFVKNANGSFDHWTCDKGTWNKATKDGGIVTQLQAGSDGSLAYSSRDANGDTHVHKLTAQGVRQEWWTHPKANDPLGYVIINDGSKTTVFSHWQGNPNGNIYYDQDSDVSNTRYFQVEYNAATRSASYQPIEGPTNSKPTGEKQTFNVADLK